MSSHFHGAGTTRRAPSRASEHRVRAQTPHDHPDRATRCADRRTDGVARCVAGHAGPSLDPASAITAAGRADAAGERPHRAPGRPRRARRARPAPVRRSRPRRTVGPSESSVPSPCTSSTSAGRYRDASSCSDRVSKRRRSGSSGTGPALGIGQQMPGLGGPPGRDPAQERAVPADGQHGHRAARVGRRGQRAQRRVPDRPRPPGDRGPSTRSADDAGTRSPSASTSPWTGVTRSVAPASRARRASVASAFGLGSTTVTAAAGRGERHRPRPASATHVEHARRACPPDPGARARSRLPASGARQRPRTPPACSRVALPHDRQPSGPADPPREPGGARARASAPSPGGPPGDTVG